ncbi:MAG: hypothetical protein ACREIQ_05290, partial [Nitrospiria bacterium]
LKAVRCGKEGRIKKERDYLLHPTPFQAEEFLLRYQSLSSVPTLAFDIETPYDRDIEKDEDFSLIEDLPSYTILRISFSFEEGKAITMPWREPYISVARALLGGQRPKTVWNEAFDVPRLEANGCPVNGLVVDSMQAWHALEPSLPMGLKFVATFYCPDLPPWKLLSRSDPEWYSAADSDALLCCYNGIRSALGRQGRWGMFLRHFGELGTVLRSISRKGILVDLDKRREGRERLGRLFTTEVQRCQNLVPEMIKPVKVYKKTEEQLKKAGLWVEGKMHVIQREEDVKVGYSVNDGWVTRVTKKPRAAGSATKRVRRKNVAIPSQSES